MADGGVPFQEAIDFLRGKVNLPTQRWDDLLREAHVRAFTVAGVTRDDMLADFRAAMGKARDDGTGLKAFRKDFDAIVDRTGWRFKARGETDEERRAWRARIIYTTNMRTSYMGGRYKQMTDPDVVRYRPFWQYKHSGSAHPRQTHLALDEKVFAWDDPIWEVYFPPNGFGCRCDVVALSRRQMERLGKSGPDGNPLPGPYPGRDPRTGEIETRYPGVDRGWEYNVGKSWVDGVVPSELRTPLTPIDAATVPRDPGTMPAPRPPVTMPLAAGLPEEAYAQAFLSAFGITADETKLFRDASGGVITIGRALFERRDRTGAVMGLKADHRGRGRFLPQVAETIIDPDEIWIDWARVASGVVLKRAYLRRIVMPDGQLLARFEWTSKGWVAATGFAAEDEDYLQGLRRGVLLYRRPE